MNVLRPLRDAVAWRECLRLGLPLPEIAGGSLLSGWQGMEHGMRLIYDNLLTAAATTVTISGLNGNRDLVYQLVMYIQSGGNASTFVRPNNDTGSNYTYGYVGRDSVGNATGGHLTTHTGFIAPFLGASGREGFLNGWVYAKSGFRRKWLAQYMQDVNGTTITEWIQAAGLWHNTTDNITSLAITHGAASGLGVDTRIMLFALR